MIEGKNVLDSQMLFIPIRVKKWYLYTDEEWDGWIFHILWEREREMWIFGIIVPGDIRWVENPEIAPLWFQEFLKENPYYGKSTVPIINGYINSMIWDSKIGSWLGNESYG